MRSIVIPTRRIETLKWVHVSDFDSGDPEAGASASCNFNITAPDGATIEISHPPNKQVSDEIIPE